MKGDFALHPTVTSRHLYSLPESATNRPYSMELGVSARCERNSLRWATKGWYLMIRMYGIFGVSTMRSRHYGR